MKIPFFTPKSEEILELQEKLNREKKKRYESEKILETKSLELYEASKIIEEKNTELIEKNEKITLQQEELKSAVEELLALNEHLESVQKELQAANTDMQDSITYSKKIQNAIIPGSSGFKKIFKECMLYYLPKDIISGDFYWYKDMDSHSVVVIADCTGHGVPGALMSVLGVCSLDKIFSKLEFSLRISSDNKEIEMPRASDFLNEFNQEIKNALLKNIEGTVKDGMDMAIVIFDKASGKIDFSSARRPMWIVRNEEIIEYSGDRKSVGFSYDDDVPFTSLMVDILKGDKIFLFSDGITDQFGGGDRRKLTSRRLKEFLVKNRSLDFTQFRKEIETWFENWKEGVEQTDDIVIFGFSPN